MVSQFYADIARLPQISDQEMCTSMQQLSIQQNDEFDTIAALKELYIYVTTYKEQVCFKKYNKNFIHIYIHMKLIDIHTFFSILLLFPIHFYSHTVS